MVSFASFVSALISWILIRRHTSALPGCGIKSDCETVVSSRWGSWLGIPVSLPSIAVYLGLTILELPQHGGLRLIAGESVLDSLTITLGLIAGASGVWFVAIQLFVIRRLCPYCLVVQVIGAGVCTILLASRGWQVSPTFLLPAAFCVAALVVGQLLVKPRSYRIAKPDSMTPTDAPSSIGQEGLPPSDTPPRNRPISLAGSRVRLDLNDWPILGPKSARYVLGFLFDYACISCRHNHRLLHQAVQDSKGLLAVVLIPCPTDPDCNPFAQRRGGTSGCSFARLALTVWDRAPDRFAEFERRLLREPQLSGIDAAIQIAEEAVCNWKFDDGEARRRYFRKLGQAIGLHRSSGIEAVPVLLLPRATVSGEIPTLDELLKLLEKELGLMILPATGSA